MKVRSIIKQTTDGTTSVSTFSWDNATPSFVGAFRSAVLAMAAVVTSMGAQQIAGLGGVGTGARSTFSFEYSVSGDGGDKYFDQFPTTWYNLAESDVQVMKTMLDTLFDGLKVSYAQVSFAKTKT